jgi:hypothetical protein
MMYLLVAPVVLIRNFAAWVQRKRQEQIASRPLVAKPIGNQSVFRILQIASIISGALLFVTGLLTGAAIGVLLAPILLTVLVFVLLVWLVKALR